MRIASILIILASMIPLLAVDATESKVVQSGGTVIAWGCSDIPTGLIDVVSIATGDSTLFALTNKGTVIKFGCGLNSKAFNVPELTGVIQIVARPRGLIALKNDGTVIAWDSSFGIYTNMGWTDVVKIAASPLFVIGLKRDGLLVVKTGDRFLYDLPIDVIGVVAIAAGGPSYPLVVGNFGLALKNDGTIVALEFPAGFPIYVPANLSGVVDIVANETVACALKNDGTLVKWDTGIPGQVETINGLSDLIDFTTGGLALKKDGKVIVWGGSQSNVPAGLKGVKAIAGNSISGLAIMHTPIIAQPVSVTTPNPTIGPGGVLTISQVLRNTLSINVTENYLASPPPGFTLIPGSCTSTIGGCVIESTPTSSQNQTGLARRSLDQSQLNSQTLTWSGVIPRNGTVTITYQIRVGTQIGGSRQVCFTPTLGGAPATPTCVMVAPLSGPGNVPLAAGLPQKPGSVLIYNSYTSTVNTALSETQITLTNTNPVDAATVHLFFVDGATCTVADQTVTLTQSQTASFLASDVDPGVTGYLIAVAVDQNGCPTINNYLIGGAMVRFESGHHASLPAIGVSRLIPQSINCGTATVVATISFNGVEYDELPRALAIHSLPSLATGNSPLLIVNRLGGNLTNGAGRLGTLAGLLFDDSEVSRSFMLNGGECQVRGLIGNNYPRTVPRYTTVIPAGRTGWMKFWANGDEAITGAMINEAPSGLSGGHNLHALTTTASATLTIPVIPAS
jgi:hypothetical protein